MSESQPNTPQKTRNARACEACRLSKSRCSFRDSTQIVCQKCEQSGQTCVIRTKARPLRARTVRPTHPPTQKIVPRQDESNFSFEFPSTPAPDTAGAVRDLHDHHKEAFEENCSDVSLDDTVNDGPCIIQKRSLKVQEAEELLLLYRNKSSFFPFVVIPPDATVLCLAKTSPFLLLAIFTAASIKDPPLRHQTDQEFRRILSDKVIINGQKSLDFLQGLLIYIAWYPIHSNPKCNQTLMYMNLAISLSIDLGLSSELPNHNEFSDIKREGLVVDGNFTQAARRAYLGAYYISSNLSMGFQKPTAMQFRNLMDSRGETLLINEEQVEVTALINLQRIIEKIFTFHRNKGIDRDDPNYEIAAEITIRNFEKDLDEWRIFTPVDVRNLTYIAIEERFAFICIYSHELGFLRRPYKKEISASAPLSTLTSCLTACKTFFEYLLSIPETLYLHFSTLQWTQMVQATLVLSRLTFALATHNGWDSETTRANVPLLMYLDALCWRFQKLSPGVGKSNSTPLFVFRMVLESLKVSYEKRVNAIVPRSVVPEGRGSHCPIFDPALRSYFYPAQSTPESGGSLCNGSYGELGQSWRSDKKVASFGASDTPHWHDLWATMTGSWVDLGSTEHTDSWTMEGSDEQIHPSPL